MSAGQLAPAPGSAEWLRYMTASKISAVVGTSPYESAFSLWHRMHGDLGPQEQTAPMALGHILEPAIAQWLADQHDDLPFARGAWVTHPRIAWAAATPDGFLGDHGCAEVKTARRSWEWRAIDGAPQRHRAIGIPAGYYDQVQWQMWVTGRTVTYVGALVDMELVERVVPIDRGRVEYLIDAAEAFMASLTDHRPPPIDGSTSTYQAVRDLHPEIDGEDVEVDGSVLAAWLNARGALDAAKTEEVRATSALLGQMGTARRAVLDGHPIARRQPARGGRVALYQISTTLTPETTQEPAA